MASFLVSLTCTAGIGGQQEVDNRCSNSNIEYIFELDCIAKTEEGLKNMLKRVFIFGLFTSGLQVLLYLILLFLTMFIQLLFLADNNRELISEFAIYFSVILFASFIIVQNLITALIDKVWFKWTAFIFATIFYVIDWSEDFNSTPLQTILFLIIGITVLTSKLYMDKAIEKRWLKKTRR